MCSYSIGSSNYKPWLLSGSFCMNQVNLEVHELLILFSHTHFLLILIICILYSFTFDLIKIPVCFIFVVSAIKKVQFNSIQF